MKIIAINGSPRGENGVSYKMVEEFFKGARQSGAETQHVLLAEKKIHHCIGCFTCWTKTPGICIFPDDMQTVDIIDIKDSDIVLFATPLYVDNISGLLKNFLDRRISAANPLMAEDSHGEAIHPKKGKRPKIMIMANGGFPGQSHFVVLKLLFRRIARNWQTELIGEIYRDEGPLIRDTFEDKKLEEIVEGYKKVLQKAGSEIAQNLRISETTQKQLEQPLMPHDLYYQRHNEWVRSIKK